MVAASSPMATSSRPRTESEPSSSTVVTAPRDRALACSRAISGERTRTKRCELCANSSLGRHLGDQPPLADDDHLVGGERHLAHQVARDEHRAALAGQALQQVADPADPVGVEPVHRLVEEQHLGVTEQRGGDAETLAHAEGELPRPPSRHRGEPDDLEHLVDPLAWRCGSSRPASAGGPGRCARGGWPWPRAAPRPRGAAREGRGRGGRSPSRCRCSGASRPMIIRIVVDLPEPLGPRNPVTTPGRTVKLSWSTASLSP